MNTTNENGLAANEAGCFGNADQVGDSLPLVAEDSKPSKSTRAKVEALKPLLDRVNRSFCWIYGADGPRRIKEPLGDDKVAAHVDGRQRFGACPMTPGSDTTRLGLLDFDDHAGELDFSAMRATAELVRDSLALSGFFPVLFRSSGGKGIHLFLLFENDQDAYCVRETLRMALNSCGLKNGTGGVAKQEVEIFPKNVSIPADGFGSMFALPFSGKSAPLDDGDIEWKMSPNAPVCDRPAPREQVTAPPPAELARLKSALDAIPNADLSYDLWRNVLFAVHYATEGSDDGLALVQEWSARSAKHDADFTEHRVWNYIRTERGGPVVTERTLFNLASAHGWTDPDVVDAFDVLDGAESAPPKLRRFKPVQAGEFSQNAKPLEWIVKRVLPRAGLGVVYGESGSGKSFFTLDLTCAAVRGLPWNERRSARTRVVYIFAEGQGGAKNRADAYSLHHGVPLSELDLHLIPAAPNLLEKGDVKELIDELKLLGSVGVVVCDTWAQVTAGADENSGKDMGRAIAQCGAIHAETGAMVLLVAHSGKNIALGIRGWSGLKAALDVEIEVTCVGDDRMARISKMKDGEGEGDTYGFRLKKIYLGEDKDGDPVTSCAVDYSTSSASVQKVNAGRKARGTGANERLVIRLFKELVALAGGAPTPDELARAAKDQMNATGARDRRREMALKAIDSVTAAGVWRVIDGRLYMIEAPE